MIVREDSPELLELEIAAPARKQRLARLVLPSLVLLVIVAWVLTLAFVGPGMILVPLGFLALAGVAAGYAPLAWLRGRIRVKVDSASIFAQYEKVGAFFDTNTFLDTLRELHACRAANPDPLFGQYEIVALRSDMTAPWVAIEGLESLEQANDIAERIRTRLGLGTSAAPVSAAPTTRRMRGRTLLSLSSTSLLVSIGSALVFVVVAPRGRSLARADLLTEQPISLELAAGDRLRFYADIEIDGATHPNMSLKGLESWLSETKLRLELVDATGRKLEQECWLYRGVAEQKLGGLTSAEISGMSTDCSFNVERAGRHTLHARVGWGRNPRRATLRIHED